MKCPECGYEIPGGVYRCLCCGYVVRSLRPLTEEELRDAEKRSQGADNSGYKEINPDDIHMGRSGSAGRSPFDGLFAGSPFSGLFGGIFESFGSVIQDFFGGTGFMEEDDGYYEIAEEEEYTYDALGYRVKKDPAETIVVRHIEEYDEHGERRDQKKKKKDKNKGDK